MRTQTFFRAMLALSIIFASFTAKAQLDTAWFQCDYGNQYIFPPLADSNYRYEGFNSILSHGNSFMVVNNNGQGENIRRFAQRYEVKDSIKIMGVAGLIYESPSFYGYYNHDTITIGIWDETLSNELYSKTFVSGGINRPYLDTVALLRFVEYLFDDTITLYNDYHISVFMNDPCPFGWSFRTTFSCLCLKEYVSHLNRGTNVAYYCTPSGCGTKYPLYVSFCCRDELSGWVRAVDVTNWYNEIDSYEYHCAYPYTYDGGTVVCDTIVHAPVGICPIRALEDTVSQDTVSQDTTSSSVLSVELLEKAVRVYPNPANEVLNVACDYDIESIAVFDAVNRLVEERKVNAKTLQLPLANYSSGTYFITITTPKGKLNKKFVVQ